jgi:DNA replication licensing factor MCM7
MLVVDLDDVANVRLLPRLIITSLKVLQHEHSATELAFRIANNTHRYVKLFCEVVDELMPSPTKDISDQDEVIDVILHQRRERNRQTDGTADGFPDHLLRR